MTHLFTRFASLFRAVASLGVFTALAAPSEALALCLDTTGCVCAVPGRKAAFIATAVDIDTSVQPNVAKLRIDVLKVAAGETSELAEGGEISMTDSLAKQAGTKVLGFTRLESCSDDTGCPMSKVETPFLQSTFGQDGKLDCGPVSLSQAEAIDLIVGPDCRTKMNERLEEAGVDLGCNDVGCVSIARGAPAPLPLSAAIVLGLGGLALARRRRPRNLRAQGRGVDPR